MNFRQRYQFNVKSDLIGKGGFSKVYRAWDTVRKRNVALKFFYGEWSEKYDVIGEINRMEDLVHPNLIRYYDATVISSTSVIGEEEKIQVGILEFADYGDISKLFQTDNFITIRKVISQLLEGLSFLHKNDIVHRDLKPKNVLLSQTKGQVIVKIADFGISKKIGGDDGDNSTQLLGSIEYMAPEQFNAKKYGIDGQLSTNVDLWSLGIIIYELFTRSTPFGNRSTGLTNEEILNNILFNPIEINYAKLEEPYKTMVKKCLEKNANDRVKSAEELLRILNSPIGAIPNTKSNKPEHSFSDENETQILPNPKELIEKVEQQNFQKTTSEVKKEPSFPSFKEEKKPSLKPLKPLAEIVKSEPVIQAQKTTPKRIEIPNSGITNTVNGMSKGDIDYGKEYFKSKDYVNSYAYLNPFIFSGKLDTEAKFYVGYMLYNGKCGGDHDPSLGKKLMDEAKNENRTLVMDLMVKYILNDN